MEFNTSPKCLGFIKKDMREIKIKEKLKRIIDDLKSYDPEKIILFGSYARGNAKKDSDIDLLIIKKTKKSKSQRTDEVFDLIYNKKDFGKEIFDTPIEPHIYNPKEMKERLSLGDFYLKEILAQGKIIYEK